MIILDGNRMSSRKRLHIYLKRKFDLPIYYGNNLDGLWDILSSSDDSMNIVLFNKEKLEDYLGSYGLGLIKVFMDASDSNKNIKFKIVDIRIRNK